MPECPYNCGTNHRVGPTPTNCDNYPTSSGGGGAVSAGSSPTALAEKSVLGSQRGKRYVGPFSDSQDQDFSDFLADNPEAYIDGEDLGFEGGPYACVQTNDECDALDFEMSDNMAFHVERGLDDSLVDEDGDLTLDTSRKIGEFYAARLKKVGVPDEIADSVEVDTTFEDDPRESHYKVSFRVPADVAEGKTLGQVTEKYLTPMYNDVTNTTDPGSFGSPYLFDAIAGDKRNY